MVGEKMKHTSSQKRALLNNTTLNNEVVTYIEWNKIEKWSKIGPLGKDEKWHTSLEQVKIGIANEKVANTTQKKPRKMFRKSTVKGYTFVMSQPPRQKSSLDLHEKLMVSSCFSKPLYVLLQVEQIRPKLKTLKLLVGQ